MKDEFSTPILSWKTIFSSHGLTGIIFILVGLALALPGIYLITLGGSAYYAIAGIGIIVSGVLLVMRKYEGICVYGAVFIGTIIWALAEVGLDGWKLMPRLLAPAILGIWLGLPIITNRMSETSQKRPMLRHAGWAASVFCLIIAVSVIGLGYRTTAIRYQKFADAPEATNAIAKANPPVADGDWRYYGRTANGDRFSPLAQITPDNVSKLKVAWTFHSGDLPKKSDTTKGREF